jgi:hypothetical protein
MAIETRPQMSADCADQMRSWATLKSSGADPSPVATKEWGSGKQNSGSGLGWRVEEGESLSVFQILTALRLARFAQG